MKSTNERLKEYDSYLRLQNYALSTRSAYLQSLRFFCEFRYDQKIVGNFNQEHAKQFLLFRHDIGCSWSLINIHYSGIKNYFTGILNHKWDFKKLPRPRIVRKLPGLISKEEVCRIIEHATMFKYQVLLTLLYSTGIRISELCNLELQDIYGDRLQIHIRLGKGGKDSIVHLPNSVLELLRNYYKRYLPRIYLFNGQHTGSPISLSAVNAAIRNARHRAGIIKPVSAHTFRHCYVTHHCV